MKTCPNCKGQTVQLKCQKLCCDNGLIHPAYLDDGDLEKYNYQSIPCDQCNGTGEMEYCASCLSRVNRFIVSDPGSEQPGHHIKG